MANNRLWAVCKDCNDAQFITKYYPSGSGWGLPEDVGGINKFLEKHDKCPSNGACGENILFVTELDDRVKLYDYTNSYKGETKIYIKKDE